MKLYSSHFRPRGPASHARPPLLVKEGFSWPCLFLGWVGLLLPPSWIAALLAGAVSLALLALLRHAPDTWPVFAGLRVLLASFANDLRRWELRRRGFAPGPLVGGTSSESALLRLLDRRPDLLGGGA